MKTVSARKILEIVGILLGVIGALLMLGSGLTWTVGLDQLIRWYESILAMKLYLIAFLIGLGLFVLGCVLAARGSGATVFPPSPAPAPTPEANWLEKLISDWIPGVGSAPAPAEAKRPCGKCQAPNDGNAKFCNQCGSAMESARAER